MTQFDVAISYASEQRWYVTQVAEIIRGNGLEIFFDKFKQSDLWGRDLTKYLHAVFSKKSKFCIMFISKEYVEKAWPTLERQSAMEKQVEVKDGYILPVRFDNTVVPEFSSSISYIDARVTSPSDLAMLFLEKFSKENEHDHTKELIMACTHVLDDNKPIGSMDDEIKSNTMLCQECIDIMAIDTFDEKNLPKEVHLICKYCVLDKQKEKLKNIASSLGYRIDDSIKDD